MSDITLVLDAMSRGENQASDKLLPLVYEELRNLAAARMFQEAAGHTLQPTALVHEAWLRLTQGQNPSWQNRAHFFGAAAEAMRRILVEHARRKAGLKRGGGQQRLNIEDVELANAPVDERVLLIDSALEELERSNPERARVVVMKFFAGMTNQEVADSLDISRRSVDRHWECAKAWLFRKIHQGG
ncbi:MAG TPA: sigma-70 family RNA polymerase sigma factor [Verrucomicrobiae bacterium]